LPFNLRKIEEEKVKKKNMKIIFLLLEC